MPPLPLRPIAPLRPLGLPGPAPAGGPLVPYRAPAPLKPGAPPKPGPAPRPPGSGAPPSGNPLADALGAGAEILGRFLWGMLNGRGPESPPGPIGDFVVERGSGKGMTFVYRRIQEGYTVYDCSPAGGVKRTVEGTDLLLTRGYPNATQLEWANVPPQQQVRICGFSGGPPNVTVYPTRWYGERPTGAVPQWHDGTNEGIANGTGGTERWSTTVTFVPVRVYGSPSQPDLPIPDPPQGERQPLPVPPPPVPILGGPPAAPAPSPPLAPSPSPQPPAGDPLPQPDGGPAGGPGGSPGGGVSDRVVPFPVPTPVPVPVPFFVPSPPVGQPVAPVPSPVVDPVPDVPVTRPGDRVIFGTPIPSPVRDVVPTIEGVAVEVGRLELKLEALLERDIDLGPIEALLVDVLDELQEVPGGVGIDAIGLTSECRRDENGDPLPPLQYAFGRSDSRLVTVLNQLDALGAALQGVVDLPTHVCRRPPPIGQRVNVDFYVAP